MYQPKQGDIITINFNPVKGHEQKGYSRPAIVISNNFFNKKTNMTIVVPITNTNNHFPLHVPLDDRVITTGVVLCEHVKALDVTARDVTFIEKLPEDILQTVIHIIFSEIEYQIDVSD